MDERSFTKKLKDIRAEVLALKQAHEYGLASTDFPMYFVDLPEYDGGPSPYADQDIVVVATFPTTAMPYFDIFLNYGTYQPKITWSNSTLTIRVEYIELNQTYVMFSIPPTTFTYESVERNV